MTDTSTNEGTETKNVRLAVLMVVLALVVLGGAVVWAGGIDGVAQLLGFGDRDTVAEVPPKPEVPATDPAEEPAPADEASEDATETVEPAEDDATGAAAPATSGTGSSTSTSPQTASTTPATASTTDISAAQADMYREQLQSQVQLGKLVSDEISSVKIGTAANTATRSQIPITVSYKAGGSLSGSMVLAKTDDLWFFQSITASGRTPSAAKPRGVNSDVVKTITEQQSTAANQDLMTRGLVQGGFESARVDGVTQGSGTATVNVTLLGGSLDRKAARFVLISSVDSGTKNWFVTRFELK